MISHTSEYALRAALFLAARAGHGPASAHEISEAVHVPVGYLQKVLRMLTRHGILSAQRGTHGGFTLARQPSAVSVLDILLASETQVQRIERCPLGIEGHAKLCPLHRMLDDEMARAQRRFAGTSLTDLLDGRGGGVRPLCDSNGVTPVRVSGRSGSRSSGPKKT